MSPDLKHPADHHEHTTGVLTSRILARRARNSMWSGFALLVVWLVAIFVGPLRQAFFFSSASTAEMVVFSVFVTIAIPIFTVVVSRSLSNQAVELLAQEEADHKHQDSDHSPAPAALSNETQVVERPSQLTGPHVSDSLDKSFPPRIPRRQRSTNLIGHTSSTLTTRARSPEASASPLSWS